MRLSSQLLSVLPLLFMLGTSCTGDKPLISDLKCEYLVDPCGIDVQFPRLSWELLLTQRGQKQSACQVLVASSEKLLKAGVGDLWDSGRMDTDRSVHLPYRGRELEAREKVFWKVRIWDHKGVPSDWSRTASWEMGLNPTDWEAVWIGLNQYKELKPEGMFPAIYFRKSAEIPGKILKARAYICGLGYYELSINGVKVGDHVLSPNHTNYDRRQSPSDFDEKGVSKMSTRVLYEIWDITSFLNEGGNSFEVCLGNGWYFQDEREENFPYSYDTPRFIAQFELEFADGSRKRILSDESWEASFGPILHNGVYSGEVYDARLENHEKLLKAIPVRAPEGRLRAQMSPPDRIVRTIKPLSMSKPAEGIYRYDLGEMISGWARLQISGPRGTVITMNFIEEAGSGYGQTDSYILKGEGDEIWEPRFTWHAFRTIDVISPLPLHLDNLTGVVVNTDVEAAGTFQCSNELFNTIQVNFQRTQLGNMHGGVPSDCPHRERRGYTGDGQIAAQAAIYTFDMASFYTKWMHDLSDAQNPETGYVPNTVPFQSGGGGTAWGSAYVIIPWYMYLYYGDEQILKQHYSGMKLWITYLSNLCDESGILIEKKLGEWVPPAATEIPPSLVSTAYFYHNLKLMSNIASVLEKQEDSRNFQELAKGIKEAFNREYYRENSSSYSIGRQGANVFALGFDLVPEHRKKEVFESLVRHIESTTDEHFDTGMMGTPLALDVLTRFGRMDLAYSMMNQHDYPSFGFAIDQGATAIWETWLGDASHSHPMFGSVCQWFYQALAGINPDPDNPGFRHTIIKPQVLQNLEYAGASYESPYGTIESRWEWDEKDLLLNLGIPANTTATLILPAANPDDVSINGRASASADHASELGYRDSLATYRVTSGHYRFRVKDVRSFTKTSRLSVPIIIPADTLLFFPDTALVKILSDDEKALIRYTLNGKEPDENSPVYSEALKINSNTIIKAKLFRAGYSPGSYSLGSLTFVDPELNGLSYQYYEGSWEQIPDFTALEPIRRGYIYDIGLDQIPFKQEKFALVLQGAIEIPADGTYTFYVNSNDGSKLFINGELLIDNDGPHGALEKQGSLHLSEGRHRWRITYFQAGGGFHLKASMKGPGMEKENISPDMLFKSLN